jgi:hypothetical protein
LNTQSRAFRFASETLEVASVEPEEARTTSSFLQHQHKSSSSSRPLSSRGLLDVAILSKLRCVLQKESPPRNIVSSSSSSLLLLLLVFSGVE